MPLFVVCCAEAVRGSRVARHTDADRILCLMFVWLVSIGRMSLHVSGPGKLFHMTCTG